MKDRAGDCRWEKEGSGCCNPPIEPPKIEINPDFRLNSIALYQTWKFVHFCQNSHFQQFFKTRLIYSTKKVYS